MRFTVVFTVKELSTMNPSHLRLAGKSKKKKRTQSLVKVKMKIDRTFFRFGIRLTILERTDQHVLGSEDHAYDFASVKLGLPFRRNRPKPGTSPQKSRK